MNHSQSVLIYTQQPYHNGCDDFRSETTFILFVSISLTQSQIDGQSQLNATQLNYCDMCHTFILFINICIKMPPFAKCLPVQWSILFVESVYCKINDIDICLKWIESNICLIFYEHMSTQLFEDYINHIQFVSEFQFDTISFECESISFGRFWMFIRTRNKAVAKTNRTMDLFRSI